MFLEFLGTMLNSWNHVHFLGTMLIFLELQYSTLSLIFISCLILFPYSTLSLTLPLMLDPDFMSRMK
jgi:hypothetical protein